MLQVFYYFFGASWLVTRAPVEEGFCNDPHLWEPKFHLVNPVRHRAAPETDRVGLRTSGGLAQDVTRIYARGLPFHTNTPLISLLAEKTIPAGEIQESHTHTSRALAS